MLDPLFIDIYAQEPYDIFKRFTYWSNTEDICARIIPDPRDPAPIVQLIESETNGRRYLRGFSFPARLLPTMRANAISAIENVLTFPDESYIAEDEKYWFCFDQKNDSQCVLSLRAKYDF